jgi:hypothetical protein
VTSGEDGQQVHDGAGDEERNGTDDNDRMIDVHVESLARDLCDTYYLTVDVRNPMREAFSKITEKTRDHWRAQAGMLIEKGWTNARDTADIHEDRPRRKPRRW